MSGGCFKITTGFILLIGLSSNLSAEDQKSSVPREAPEQNARNAPDQPKEKPKTEIAVFGGGCFWSIEAIFERMPGVKSVISGFSGGTVPNPDYETVCTGRTGHAEVVRIEYDPSVVPFEKLLMLFWMAHDPTTWNRQGDDFGPQYRSIILYLNDAQKEAVLKSYHDLTDRHVFGAPIVTELVPFRVFYPAERYHQNYFRNQRYSNYSLTYIVPKLKKLHLMK